MATRKKRAASERPADAPVATGTVTEGTKPPRGHYWDLLDAAGDDVKKLEALEETLDTHGYSGQIMTATREKLRAAKRGRK